MYGPPLFAVWMTLIGLGFTSAPAAADRPPNVILILADDLGWADFRLKIHPQMQGPNDCSLAFGDVVEEAKLVKCGISFGGWPGLLLIGLTLALPSLVVLFWLSFRFATSSRQRLANMLCGLAGAVGSIIGVITVYYPPPGTWCDANFEWIVVGIAPFGAALGTGIAIMTRHCASRWCG